MNCKLLSLLCIVLFIACKSRPVVQVINEGNVATDSILLCRQDSTIIINIGDRLDPAPLSSQIYAGEDNETYVMLEENKLHLFNLSTGTQYDTLSLKGCGKLNSYSGFLYTKDTIFVYNYKQKVVYCLDSALNIVDSWDVRERCKAKYPLDPEALTLSPILYFNGNIVLSGSGLGSPDDATPENRPISCCINVSTGGIIYGSAYPEQYVQGEFGGVYFNSIYQTVDKRGNYIYSFPADHSVYFYRPDLSKYEKVYMGSRYVSKIESSGSNSLDLFKDKSLRIRYYISQPSYANIVYDKFRDLYYRIVEHPFMGQWESGQNFSKPFSIIVMDGDKRIVTETPIIKDYAQLNLGNVHVPKAGLLIQKNCSDENRIEFIVYKMN